MKNNDIKQLFDALVVAEQFIDRHSEKWYLSGQADLKQIREAISIIKNNNDWPESEEFYNLMQTYRHAPMEDQKAVVDAYEAVKEYLRGLY